MKLALLAAMLALAAVLMLGASTADAQVSPPCGTRPSDFRPIASSACRAGAARTKTACDTLNRRCQCQWQTAMKWTGPPCAGGTNDGGCRCGTFCGFKCDRKCFADKQCIKNINNQCVNKISGDVGETSLCYMTRAPTTLRPSGSPTVSKPSVSPTTPRPSIAPSTAKPSAAPSRTPSKTPSGAPSRAPSGAPSRTPSRTPSAAPSKAPIIPTFTPSRGPGSASCKPSDGLSAPACAAIRQYCVTQSIIMKFAGPGCLINGKRLRDGGCQCQGYCGYGCAKACRRDAECFWDTAVRSCKVKATNATGVKIPQCNEQFIAP